MLDGVRDWLSRGGYVLEMSVAQKIAKRTNYFWQGFHYLDPITQQEREGDLQGLLNFRDVDEHDHAVQFVIECKNTTAPWVFFTGETDPNGTWHARFYLDWNGCSLCRALMEDYSDLLGRTPIAYAVSEKRTGGAKDLAHDAVQKVTSALAAEYTPQDEGEDAGHPDTKFVSHIGVPIVVTRSPLVMCTLDEGGDADLQTLTRVTVAVPRENLPVRDQRTVAVTVVNLDSLDDLLDELERLGDGDRPE